VVGSWVPDERLAVRADLHRILSELMPDMPLPGKSRPLGDAGDFRAEMEAAGFRNVEIHEVAHELETPSIEEYWKTMECGTAPYRAVSEWAGPERWTGVRQQLIERLKANYGTGPLRIPMIANLGVGDA